MKKQKTILFITSTLDIRGRHSHLLSLVRVLIQRGYKVEVAAKPGNMISQFQQELIRVHRLDLTGIQWKDFFCLRKLAKLLKKSNANYFHIVGEDLFWMGPWLSKFTKLPYFMTVNQFLQSEKQIPIGTNCLGIISVSQALREFLVNQLNIPNKLVHVIPNGIDIFRFNLPKYHPENVPKVVTSIGRMEPGYGQETFIHAIAKLVEKKQNFHFLLVGEGPEERNLRDLVRKLNLTQEIIFCISRIEYERILRITDIYVSPTLSEGLGQTTLEAMSCGVPVVATKVGGIFTVVQDHETGILVPKENPEAMAEAILEIASDIELSEMLSKNARNIIQTQFNLAQMVDAIEEFYEERYQPVEKA